MRRTKSLDKKEKTTERFKPLNLRDDANVRTLLAWSAIVSNADCMHGGYADRQARYTKSVHHATRRR